MRSTLISCLFVCLLVIDYTCAQWSVEGDVGTSKGGGWKVGVKVKFSWGRKKKRNKRGVDVEMFDVVIMLRNNKTGSSVRLSPCDYALYDQNGDLEVTMADFEIIFEHDEEQKHQLVKLMFNELDINKDNKISAKEFEERKHNVISKDSCQL
ncbi:uncharacterized protein LOC130046301 [Ostrea edulis]|uniref:uncharacterized protein LOC130046301 n=1 Tax=Ostrea edulis TaxID=37623 RepID=UPI002095468C|nr:uncharacterized protein LOC130046301 [Ostrea edulis]